jgi:alpha/beta superfamily hydrolase
MKPQPRFVTFGSEGPRLEGVFTPGGEGKRPALFCAPHPLYGGSMDNEVIVTLADALADMGHPVLRFNYRGVGRSEGEYGGGGGEAADAASAADFLMGETEAGRVMVVAYSFGAWVAMMCRQARGDLDPLVLLSPPNRMMDFDFDIAGARLFVLAGTRDDYCDLELLARQFPANVTPIEGADHFYGRGLEVLRREVSRIARELDV